MDRFSKAAQTHADLQSAIADLAFLFHWCCGHERVVCKRGGWCLALNRVLSVFSSILCVNGYTMDALELICWRFNLPEWIQTPNRPGAWWGMLAVSRCTVHGTANFAQALGW